MKIIVHHSLREIKMNEEVRYKLGTFIYNPTAPHTQESWTAILEVMDSNNGTISETQLLEIASRHWPRGKDRGRNNSSANEYVTYILGQRHLREV